MLNKKKAYGIWKLKLTKNVLTEITPWAGQLSVKIATEKLKGKKIKIEIVHNFSSSFFFYPVHWFLSLRSWNPFHIKLNKSKQEQC